MSQLLATYIKGLMHLSSCIRQLLQHPRKDDDVISKFCFENNISCCGSLEDVLSRYYFASIQYPCSHVVRITADCPVIDPAIIDKLVQYHLDGGFDYSYLYGQYPDGLDCCIFNWSTLKKLTRTQS